MNEYHYDYFHHMLVLPTGIRILLLFVDQG